MKVGSGFGSGSASKVGSGSGSALKRRGDDILSDWSVAFKHFPCFVQERKKCEFVDGLLEFTRSWVRFYQKGNSVALEYADYLADLANRQTWIPSRIEFLNFAARWPSNLQPQSTGLTRGPPELVQHFRLQGEFTSARERCMFDMVWLYRSPIPVGRRGVISSIKCFRGKGAGVGTLCLQHISTEFKLRKKLSQI